MIAAICTLLAVALPAGTAAAAPPQLNIAIDDGVTSAKPKDKLSYTVTITNIGAAKVKGLVVRQTIPPSSSLVSVGGNGVHKAQYVTWKVDLAPTKKVTLKTQVALDGTLPDDLLRFAMIACVSTSAKTPPLVCASDSDQLPAGAKAQQTQKELDHPAAVAGSSLPGWVLPVAIVGGVLVLAAAAALVVALRRRRRRAAVLAEQPDPDHDDTPVMVP